MTQADGLTEAWRESPRQFDLSQKFPACNEALGNSRRAEPVSQGSQYSARKLALKVAFAGREADETTKAGRRRVSTGIGAGLTLE